MDPKSHIKANIADEIKETIPVDVETKRRVPSINQMATGSKRPFMINFDDKNQALSRRKQIPEQIQQTTPHKDNNIKGVIGKNRELLTKQVNESASTEQIIVTTPGATTHTIVVTGTNIIITIDGKTIKL